MLNFESVIKNKRLVQKLRNLLGGKNGLWSQIMTYVYQIPFLENGKEKYDDITKTLINDSIKISNLINDLKAKPFIENGRGIPFSSRFVNYLTDPLIFLECNIKEIKYIIKYYDYLIKTLPKDKIKVLEEIKTDEENILKEFEELLRKIENSGSQ